MNIELVVFGLIGTTVIDDGLFAEPLRAALAGADASVGQEAIDEVAGYAMPHAIRALLTTSRPTSSWSDFEVERTHARFLRGVEARVSRDEPLLEVIGASRAFWQLRQHGIKIASLTGMAMSAATAIHERLGWRARDLVDVCVTSDEVERGAPSPDAIFEAMNRAGVRESARVALVANAPSELAQGVAAGCGLVVGVFDSDGSVARVRAAPHNVLLPTCALVPELLRRVSARRIAPIAFGSAF